LRCGEILKKGEKVPPTRKGSKRAGERGKIIATGSDDRTQLKDLDITKNQSSGWQRMAKDPDAVRKYTKGAGHSRRGALAG
jgi:hypothetical protein